MSLWRILLHRMSFVLEPICSSQDIVQTQKPFKLISGMYAASANLVLTTGTGNGVNGFTLDNALGEFILTHPNAPPHSLYSLISPS
jgi:fructose-1,6-bisphosphatase